GQAEAAVLRVGGDVPVLRSGAVAGGDDDAGAVGGGARVEALPGAVHRRDRPGAAAGGEVEVRGGDARRLVPLLNRRGARVDDHRAARDQRGQHVLIAGVELRRVAVVAPDRDGVVPGHGGVAVGVLHLLVPVGAAVGRVRVRARRAAAADAVAEVADVDGRLAHHRALAGGAVAEGVGVGHAALVGAEAAGDDAVRARGEAGAVTVVGDRAVDLGLADIAQGARVDDVTEERPLLHRVVRP